VDELTFDEPGDIEDVMDIASLRLRPFDPVTRV
jgi:hypothetical protein